VQKVYSGQCHCGAVRFEANIDLDAGTVKCNCTMCVKTRMWSAMVKPEDFRLLSGESDLTDYSPDGAHHFFCRHCGVRPFGQRRSESGEPFYAVRLACLDNLNVDDLVKAPIRYVDGLNDNYQSPPAEIRHL
jgi:hypothetical protein